MAKILTFEILNLYSKNCVYPIIVRKTPRNTSTLIQSITNTEFIQEETQQLDLRFKKLGKNLCTIDLAI